MTPNTKSHPNIVVLKINGIKEDGLRFPGMIEHGFPLRTLPSF